MSKAVAQFGLENTIRNPWPRKGYLTPFPLSNTRGRLTHTDTLNSQGTALTATVQDYDVMGRITGYWQATPLNCGTSMWSSFYGYDLAGDVTGWLHPAGFIINQTVNAAREVTQVNSSLNDATHPGTLATATYTAFGSVSTVQNGCAGTGCTSLQETYQYNKRLQAAMIELGTPSNPTADSCRVYNFYDPSIPGGTSNPTSCVMPAQGTNNNGNVAGYYYQDTLNSGLGHSASYHYDAVNRLGSAAATGSVVYSESFTYDPYGNLNCGPSGPGCVAFTYTAATNRISGYTYDAAGNVTNDGTNTFQWDAESHLTKVINGQGVAISTNTYNALGQRVRDVTQTTTTDEAYGAGGSLLWRYTGNSSDPNQRAFVPFGGGILAEYYSGGTLFDHPDELGSISAASDQTGTHFQERLYYPFGESWTGVNLNNLGMHQTFAQLPDYDPETDQYNTANRHYSPSGRWMSPDPGGMKVVRLDDPQTWNMYAYVRNNPTTLEDPSGLEVAELPGRPSLPGYTPPDDTDLESGFSDWRGSLSPNTANASGASSPQNAAQNQSPPQIPTIKGVPSNQSFNTIRGAGTAAEIAGIAQTRAAAAGTNGKIEEFGGHLITNDGKSFTYTVPVTFGDPQHFYPSDVTVPNGYRVVGEYHTHPDPNSMGEGFSVPDMNVADRRHMKSYVGMSFSGNVREYTPGKTKYNGLNGVSGDLIYKVP